MSGFIRILFIHFSSYHFPIDSVRSRLLAGVHGTIVVEGNEAKTARPAICRLTLLEAVLPERGVQQTSDSITFVGN